MSKSTTPFQARVSHCTKTTHLSSSCP